MVMDYNRLFIRSSVGSGNLAEAQGIRNCVSAYTVCAVDSACNLAGSVEAGDYLAVSVDYFRVAVDLQAAHGVMDCR